MDPYLSVGPVMIEVSFLLSPNFLLPKAVPSDICLSRGDGMEGMVGRVWDLRLC